MRWTADDWKRHWSDKRELAISHGRVDFRSGKGLSLNPYPATSDNAISWEYGWNEALNEKQPEGTDPKSLSKRAATN